VRVILRLLARLVVRPAGFALDAHAAPEREAADLHRRRAPDTFAQNLAIESAHDTVAVDLDVDFRRQQDGLHAHDRIRLNLYFRRREVRVAQIQHPAAPERERGQLLGYVPSAAPLETAEQGQQQRRGRWIGFAAAALIYRCTRQVRPEPIQFLV